MKSTLNTSIYLYDREKQRFTVVAVILIKNKKKEKKTCYQ